MISFKDDRVQNEYFDAPLLLKIIVEDFVERSYKDYGILAVITRVLEEVAGASEVHGDYRAVDIRNQHAGEYLYTPQQVADLLQYINTKYARNDGKPTMIHHSFNEAPFHFHIQISVFTKVYQPNFKKES